MSHEEESHYGDRNSDLPLQISGFNKDLEILTRKHIKAPKKHVANLRMVTEVLYAAILDEEDPVLGWRLIGLYDQLRERLDDVPEGEPPDLDCFRGWATAVRDAFR